MDFEVLMIIKGDGMEIQCLVPIGTIAEVERLWKATMRKKVIPFFNSVLSRLPEKTITDRAGVKQRCKGFRISRIAREGIRTAVIRLKKGNRGRRGKINNEGKPKEIKK